MKQDPFGNLKEWGAVLDLLSQLDQKGVLGECQRGMIRILRYKENWRLREEVLKRSATLENPSQNLVQQIMAMIVDETIYYEARVLALHALARLAAEGRIPSATAGRMGWTLALQRLLAAHQPPLLANALADCLVYLDESSQGRPREDACRQAV